MDKEISRTLWRIFEIDGETHVVPRDEEGVILAPHKADVMCPCNPRVEASGQGTFIVIHNNAR